MTKQGFEWLEVKIHIHRLQQTKGAVLHDAHVAEYYSDINNFKV